jgi:endonuclease/exonuclease/phosphatase family metal-dependent hydrolase
MMCGVADPAESDAMLRAYRVWWNCGLLAGFGLGMMASGCERGQPPVPTTKPAATQASTASGPAVPTIPLGTPTGTFLDRAPSDGAARVVRVVEWNIKWNSIFSDVDPLSAARFVRVVHALDPDVLVLEEIGTSPQDRNKAGARKRTAQDVLAVMERMFALPNGGHWYAWQGADDVIVARYPLRMTADKTNPPGERGVALALVDLPDDLFDADMYFIASHHKCCGGAENDPKRQQQSDAIMSWVRDAREPGGNVELPPSTPIIILGDFNIVGGPQPLTTLLTGDVADEEKYGADFAPDWDATPLTDLHPLQNIVGPDDWTWRDDGSEFPPGRLDYILFTDSVLDVAKSFVLNTTTMGEADLQAAGLEKLDTTKDKVGKDYDHQPLVVDFRLKAAEPSAAGGE